MIIAKVVGSAVASLKLDAFQASKLLVVRQTDAQGNATGPAFLAVDLVGSGEDELVMISQGSSARVAMGNADAARWLIARQDIDYLVQMMFRLEPFHVLTAPVHLGTSSIVLATEIVDPMQLPLNAMSAFTS